MTTGNILGVDYRHVTLPTAYIRVGGRSPRAAELNAKQICKALGELLPEAVVSAPRPLQKRNGQKYVFEIPVVIGGSLEEAERIITGVLGA